MTQFHETRAGAEFYRRTMPELVKQLTRIADALERVAEGQGSAKANELTRVEDEPGQSPS
ncbi:MAG: hypothetical protein H6716_22835 [Polyangiaceae bacterium]|nr:hypothetical protein [Polyangiaceae bacterium]